MKNSILSIFYYIILFQFFSMENWKVRSSPTSRHYSTDSNFDSAITTRVIDLNNPDHDRFLKQFNMSVEQLKRIRSAPAVSTDTTISDDIERRLSDIKQLRYQDIRNKIENAVNGSSLKGSNSLPIHEMAAYPTCTQSDEISWQQENNVTINFSASLFGNTHPDMYLDTAVLRLFKLNPHSESASTSKPNNCEEQQIESQIRVTVSTLQQVKRNKRERKKRICNTIMLNIYQTGWIEIDIKKAINIWEKAQNNNNFNQNNSNNRFHVMVGYLSIEVHDEDEKPLKAGLYFEPPKCAEAYPAIPWNFYRQYSSWPSAGMEKVPRSPRLDIKLIDYRSVIPPKPTTNTHGSSHNHKIPSHHHINNNSPSLSLLPTSSDEIFDSTSSDTRVHRRRHAQNHHSRHHHLHSERQQQQQHQSFSTSSSIVISTGNEQLPQLSTDTAI